MGKVIKQVCIDMKGYYTITANSEEEAQRILDSYTTRLGGRYLKGVLGWLGNRSNDAVFAYTIPTVFVSAEGVNDPAFKSSIIVPY